MGRDTWRYTGRMVRLAIRPERLAGVGSRGAGVGGSSGSRVVACGRGGLEVGLCGTGYFCQLHRLRATNPATPASKPTSPSPTGTHCVYTLCAGGAGAGWFAGRCVGGRLVARRRCAAG